MSHRKFLLLFAFTAFGLALSQQAPAGPWSTSGWGQGSPLTCMDSPEPAELKIDCIPTDAPDYVGCADPATATGTYNVNVQQGSGPDENVAFCCSGPSCMYFRKSMTWFGVTRQCAEGFCEYRLTYDPDVPAQAYGTASADQDLIDYVPYGYDTNPLDFGCSSWNDCVFQFGTLPGLNANKTFKKESSFGKTLILAFDETHPSPGTPATAANWRARYLESTANMSLTPTDYLSHESSNLTEPSVVNYRANQPEPDYWSPNGSNIVTIDVFGTIDWNVSRVDWFAAEINGAQIVESVNVNPGDNVTRLFVRENQIPMAGICVDGQRRFVEVVAKLCTDDTVVDPATCPPSDQQNIGGRDDVYVNTNSTGECSVLAGL